MGNLFILFPVAIILGVVMHRAYHTGLEKNKAMASFRNFFFMWSVSALLVGVFSVFFNSTFVADLAVAFGLPFVYFAGAVLVFLPFQLYRKGLWIARLLSTLIVLWGVFMGVLVYLDVIQSLNSLGVATLFMQHVAANLKYYHLVALSIIFVPIGIFFLRESRRSSQSVSRFRSFLIGVGIIIAGVTEGFSIWVDNTTGVDFPDYIVPIGFLLILSGILYTRFSQV